MPRPEDLLKTKKMEICLRDFDVFESETELAHRVEVLNKINQLFNDWIKDTIINKNLPPDVAENVCGKIYPFGSYKLGVHTKGADIDILCVAPSHIERMEFFVSFVQLLKGQVQVKDLQVIEEAYVPIIKLKFDGIELDMLFAKLFMNDISENQKLRDVSILKDLDLKCIRSLNGWRLANEILHLVPNLDSFRLALRAIKLWAKKHGIYSNILGYFGGVSWSMLVARTCQLYPNATAATLVYKFFFVFSQWPWPKPVLLKAPEENTLGLDVWDPRVNFSHRSHLMPVITPAYPHQNSTVNVSFSTYTVICECIKHGLTIMDEIMEGRCGWSELFKPINFFMRYKHFIALIVSASSQKDQLAWYGLVESKIRILISHLERHPSIDIAHINPQSYTPLDVEPETCQSMWFLGLRFSETKNGNIDLTESIQNFIDTVTYQAMNISIYKKDMKIEIKHLRRRELSKYLAADILGKIKKEKCSSSNVPDSTSPLLAEDKGK